MSKNKVRIFCSPTFLIITVFTMIVSWGFLIFLFAFEPCRSGLLAEIHLLVLYSLIFGTYPIIAFFLSVRRILSRITIDETGISRSFLGRFYKLHISWDDMAEVFFIDSLVEYLMFSKTKQISRMSYWKASMVKDAIQITLSKKRYAVIKQYLQQPIVGMSDKVKARLEQEKKKG